MLVCWLSRKLSGRLENDRRRKSLNRVVDPDKRADPEILGGLVGLAKGARSALSHFSLSCMKQ